MLDVILVHSDSLGGEIQFSQPSSFPVTFFCQFLGTIRRPLESYRLPCVKIISFRLLIVDTGIHTTGSRPLISDAVP